MNNVLQNNPHLYGTACGHSALSRILCRTSKPGKAGTSTQSHHIDPEKQLTGGTVGHVPNATSTPVCQTHLIDLVHHFQGRTPGASVGEKGTVEVVERQS